jgi:hypothetical protein
LKTGQRGSTIRGEFAPFEAEPRGRDRKETRANGGGKEGHIGNLSTTVTRTQGKAAAGTGENGGKAFGDAGLQIFGEGVTESGGSAKGVPLIGGEVGPAEDAAQRAGGNLGLFGTMASSPRRHLTNLAWQSYGSVSSFRRRKAETNLGAAGWKACATSWVNIVSRAGRWRVRGDPRGPGGSAPQKRYQNFKYGAASAMRRR